MKRRITFIQRPDAPFEPHQAVLSSTKLAIRNLSAAREDRITFGLDELPEVRLSKSNVSMWHADNILTAAQLRASLEQLYELRIRWAAERSYNAATPFTSRVSPGLHVHYTPLSPDQSS